MWISQISPGSGLRIQNSKPFLGYYILISSSRPAAPGKTIEIKIGPIAEELYLAMSEKLQNRKMRISQISPGSGLKIQNYKPFLGYYILISSSRPAAPGKTLEIKIGPIAEELYSAMSEKLQNRKIAKSKNANFPNFSRFRPQNPEFQSFPGLLYIDLFVSTCCTRINHRN